MRLIGRECGPDILKNRLFSVTQSAGVRHIAIYVTGRIGDFDAPIEYAKLSYVVRPA